MAYLTLSGAILLEIAATTLMKQSDGYSRLWPTVGSIAGYLLAFALLAQALKTLDVGTAYAIWAGAGTALIAVIGMAFLGESTTPLKISGVLLVIAGVVVLNLGGAH